jgi:hypothetical protein
MQSDPVACLVHKSVVHTTFSQTLGCRQVTEKYMKIMGNMHMLSSTLLLQIKLAKAKTLFLGVEKLILSLN